MQAAIERLQAPGRMPGENDDTGTGANHGVKPPEPSLGAPRIYEAPGVYQQSDHPLGAVQSVIRGRIRFAGIGLMLVGVALFGL